MIRSWSIFALISTVLTVCRRTGLQPGEGERQEGRGRVPATHDIVQSAQSESGGAPWVADAAWAGLTPDFLTLSKEGKITANKRRYQLVEEEA